MENISIRHILCPVDFSSTSQRAFEYALLTARHHQARVHLLHVITPVLGLEAPQTAALLPPLREGAIDHLHRLVHQAESTGLLAECHLMDGPIVPSIQEVVTSASIDLVVMGTHGYGGYRRWLLGSTAQELLRRLPVPILTVSSKHPQPSAPPSIRRVLMVTDFSTGTPEAAAVARAFAREFHASLAVLHVVPDLPPASSGQTRPATLEAHLERETRQRLAALLPDPKEGDDPIEIAMKHGVPNLAILEFIREHDIDLLVMNIHSKSLLERAMLGSTAEQVIQEASCPVLAVPPLPVHPKSAARHTKPNTAPQ